MKIARITLKNYKRFTDLTISEIPVTAKLIVLVGPNGCGKTSLFDAFYHWYRLHGQLGVHQDKLYHVKEYIENVDWGSFVNIEFHDFENRDGIRNRGKFYFRTAYRNQPDFTTDRLMSQNDPTTALKFSSLTENDVTVLENYQRLISLTLSGVFKEENNNRTIENFREELIGRIKTSLSNVFDDLILSSIGDPLVNGSFYFQKGNISNFHYKNLSGGEKSAFDIILDLIIKSTFYDQV
jgi:hypothetical protein